MEGASSITSFIVITHEMGHYIHRISAPKHEYQEALAIARLARNTLAKMAKEYTIFKSLLDYLKADGKLPVNSQQANELASQDATKSHEADFRQVLQARGGSRQPKVLQAMRD